MFEQWKSELSPDDFIELIGEDCDLCPADCRIRSYPINLSCVERFRMWAGEEVQ